jgi:hypothetical protein
MVRNISVLLQAAHALAKEVAGLSDSSSGMQCLAAVRAFGDLAMLWL